MRSLLLGNAINSRDSIGLLALRLVMGAAFLFHGWGKIQNPTGWMGPDASIPAALQAAAAVSEFGGGIALIVGFLTRLAGLGLLVTMAVATYFHMSKGDPFVASGPGQGSWEPALTYCACALLFTLAGAGRWSVDAALAGEPQPGLTQVISRLHLRLRRLIRPV